MNVYILTFCRNPDLFYGTALIFKTLRVGFPNARVRVVDNASIPEARSQISALCRESCCELSLMKGPGLEHHSFIEESLRAQAMDATDHEPMVILDPDMCLWKSWEEFNFTGLITGKKIAGFHDPMTRTLTMPRIHSSFLWINDAKELWREILRIKARRFDFLPYQPFSFKLNGNWYRYDTCAGLYAGLSDKCSYFTEEHFESYDHIFGGSHLDWILDSYNAEYREMMTRIHTLAKTDKIERLKGIWREQDLYFRKSFQKTKGRDSHNEETGSRTTAEKTIRNSQSVGVL